MECCGGALGVINGAYFVLFVYILISRGVHNMRDQQPTMESYWQFMFENISGISHTLWAYLGACIAWMLKNIAIHTHLKLLMIAITPKWPQWSEPSQ